MGDWGTVEGPELSDWVIGDTVTNIDTKDRLVMQCPLQSHLLLPALCRPKDLSEGMNTLHLPFHPVSVF